MLFSKTTKEAESISHINHSDVTGLNETYLNKETAKQYVFDFIYTGTGPIMWNQDLEKWKEGQSPLGLPKVRVYKISMKKKKK